MYTFTTLLLLLSPVPDSTIYPIPYCIKETTPFKWTNYEVEVSQRFKDSALKKFRDTYSSSAGKLPDNFPESFHFLNLNGDKLVDVIYAGNAGSEGPYVNFYLNTGSIFKPCVPTQLGYVWDLKYQQNKLTAFVIYNPGCCAEVVEFERH
jgi:hypothetical protein